jgi:uncharacterized membrane protein YfcA
VITIFNLDITTLILFAFLLFSAGFVDAIGGGGGLLSVPGYLLTGLPIHTVFGTNKFAASVGTGVSFLQFLKHNKMHLGLLKYLAPMSFLGAILGVTTLQFVNPSFLKIIIPFLILVVGSYTLFNKSLGNESNYKHPKRNVLIKGMFFTLAIGFYDGFFGPGTGSFFILMLIKLFDVVFLPLFTLAIGFYDGFFGPGTGSFFILMLIKLFDVDFVEAAGNTKMLNLISNITSLIIFLFRGQVFLPLAILGSVFNLAGAFLGSHFAIKKGTAFIKPVFISISFIVAFKMLYEQFLVK